jgi:hypothetical protein
MITVELEGDLNDHSFARALARRFAARCDTAAIEGIADHLRARYPTQDDARGRAPISGQRPEPSRLKMLTNP